MNTEEYDCEFMEIVSDILKLEAFSKTHELKHHGNGLLEHSVKTSYMAYKMAKRWGADPICAARAGMLHDFFYHDWRSVEAKEIKKTYKGMQRIKNMHGFAHPFEAYENASQYFDLSYKEKDAIIKHMFPLVPLIPLYKESWIVNISDKIVAAGEMLKETKYVMKSLWKKLRNFKI